MLMCNLHFSKLNCPPVDSFSNDAPQSNSEASASASVLRAWVRLSLRIGISLLNMLFFHHFDSFLQESVHNFLCGLLVLEFMFFLVIYNVVSQEELQ